MNYGCFFEFDYKNSNLPHGIALFKYRWLENKETKDDRKTPHHPIYLSFTLDRIRFNLHYLEDGNAKIKQEKKADAKPENNIDTKPDWRHYHNTIIELPLSSNDEVSDRLTNVLNDAYQAIFPISENTFLRDDIGYSYDAQDCRKDGYAFTCFEPDKQDWYESKTPTHFLRKLILDFLYDLEFTDVFKNSPFYDQIYLRLKENFLFNALMNKTRYYYYRTVLCKQELIDPIEKESGSDEKKKARVDKRIRSFVEKYAKVERDWVTSIMDKRAMRQFHESPWFDESNEELEQVFWTRRENKWRTKQNDKLCAEKKIEEIAEIPLLVNDSHVSKARKRILHGIGADKDSFRLTVDDAIRLANKRISNHGNADSLKDAEKVHENVTNESAKWEVLHYHFGGLIKIWCGSISTLLWSLALLIPVVFGVVTWLWGVLNCIIPDKGSYVFFLVLLCCLFFEIKLFMNGHIRPTWGCGAWGLLMPRMLAAIVAAWFSMSMTNVLFKNFAIQPTLRWSAILILFLATLLFVAYESRQFNPYCNLLDNIISSIVLISIAYLYAIVVGLMVFDFFGIQMLSNAIASKEIPPDPDWCLYPPSKKMLKSRMEFILQFSFFATFIGIFLQLMFKGRPVTDSNN